MVSGTGNEYLMMLSKSFEDIISVQLLALSLPDS